MKHLLLTFLILNFTWLQLGFSSNLPQLSIESQSFIDPIGTESHNLVTTIPAQIKNFPVKLLPSSFMIAKNEINSINKKNVNALQTAPPSDSNVEMKITPTISKLALTLSFLAFFTFTAIVILLYDKKIGIKLNFKLVGGISLLLTLTTAIIWYADVATKKIGHEIKSIADYYMPLDKLVANITEHQLQQNTHLERYLRTKNPIEQEKVFNLGKKIEKEIQQALTIANKWHDSTNDQSIRKKAQDAIYQLKQIDEEHKKFEESCYKAMEMDQNNPDFNQQAKICESDANSIEHHLVEFLSTIQKHASDAASIAEQHEVDTEARLFSAGVGIVYFGLFILYMIWQASVGLVAQVKKAADSLLASSGSVSASSVQFKANSEKLAAMTQEQAAGVQEIMSTLDEMSAMANKNSEQTSVSAQKAKNCRQGAANGQKSLRDVSNAINDISSDNANVLEQIKESNKKISAISTIIEEISQKTNIINDIVFQTKLLSFNASVEAARAGEHGKGFAVVAQEVGSLAQMSGEASAEIRNMLSASIGKVNDIVKDSGNKVEYIIETSRSKVKIGQERINECNQIFTDVVQDIAEVDTAIAEIASATKEQADGIDAIAIALREIDTGTQEVAGVSQEAAAASEELSHEASSLQSNSNNLLLLVTGVNSDKKAA